MQIELLSTLLGAGIALFSAYAVYKIQQEEERKKRRLEVIDNRFKAVETYLNELVTICNSTLIHAEKYCANKREYSEFAKSVEELEETSSKSHIALSLLISNDPDLGNCVYKLHQEVTQFRAIVENLVGEQEVNTENIIDYLWKSIKAIRSLYGQVTNRMDNYRMQNLGMKLDTKRSFGLFHRRR